MSTETRAPARRALRPLRRERRARTLGMWGARGEEREYRL